jgi:hypothetical protein
MDPACCCGIDSTDCICCWLPVDYVFCVAIFAGFWSFIKFEKKLNPASLFGGVFLSKVSCELKRIIVILELNGTSHWELVT